MGSLPIYRETEDVRTCALHAEIRTLFLTDLVEMADQVDAAANHQHSGYGPQNQDWHVSSSSV